jgi:hypothetical protein
VEKLLDVHCDVITGYELDETSDVRHQQSERGGRFKIQSTRNFLVEEAEEVVTEDILRPVG